ncbi:YiiX/YebB-like N1pC/P60 family cysteine hydrolase [Neptuniibacter halophilus]|uniref:YiiX/YebB-like N1pC/P60 family cysteine hydrolase n=1 Tax=Neptuniibacter halophilus TaxID=651666 RepID=UPI002573DEF2|nr:YiiX/YebB-like N1pC/P60 family cysteine hydrolase [Neptuniibacter halophilus]
MKDLTLNQLTHQIASQIKEGDIIFISIRNLLYRQVAKGTGSWTSHVGFIVREGNEWIVLESAVPFVRRTPLKQFLARTCDNQVSIRRLKQPLAPQQITALKQVAERRMGKLYHTGFKFDSQRQFCSKFVYLTYKEALGVELGKVQTLRELLDENPQASVGFWRCWYFGLIPWKRLTITPASQLHDPKLTAVFSTLPEERAC